MQLTHQVGKCMGVLSMIRDVPQLMRNSENLSQPNLFADLMEPYNSLLKEFHAPPLPTQRALHDHDGIVVRGHQPEGDHHGGVPEPGRTGEVILINH